MTTLDILKQAKAAKSELAKLGSEDKNNALLAMADALRENCAAILEENKKDVEAARGKITDVMIDRLSLDEGRIKGMADGIRDVVKLPDPVGRVLSRVELSNGLIVEKTAVPMGVVAIIYESRPNVSSDAAALALKSGNVCVLRGGKEAFRSANAIVNALRSGLKKIGLCENFINMVQDTTRQSSTELMTADGYIDLLIPRGGAGLIKACVENATVPVIQTGTGICHVYVDDDADLDMALNIIENAKTQRLGVCNACESLVIHSKIAGEAIPVICHRLSTHHVQIRGDERARQWDARMVPATEEDFGTEYLDAIISIKIVDSLEEAIAHINHYNTGHSEAIVTADYHNAMTFLNEIDAAAVYVNASTRFTDGFEFGFGAEIGISTQKLHARGPMGLLALTTTKFIILGNGQIRE